MRPLSEPLTFVYIGNEFHSYGYSGLKLAAALRAAWQFDDTNGASSNCRLVDLLPEVGGIRDGSEWQGAPWRFEGTVVALVLPSWLPHLRADRVIAFTMFEGYGLPRERVALVNRYSDGVLVPSAWCADGFRESGVTVPIGIVPLGVEPEDWPLGGSRTAPTQPYRFLWNGLPDVRKGWDLVYKAFWDAFRGSDEVELVLHFREGLPVGQGFGDTNVQVITGYHSRPIVWRMLRDADCYVFPSRAEGWGLPPREAACTGLPVIATDYGGLAEEIENWALPVRICKETETRFKDSEDEAFLIGEPCGRDLADRMRWCFENQEAARAHGEQAARWLRAHGTWEVAAKYLRANTLGGGEGCG